MSTADWVVVVVFLGFVITDGLLKARRNRTAEDYLLASRGVPWWAMGLSVMATQASAITFVGTTGKGYTSGTGFVQFYYFLPVAMLILCATAVPFFHRARVYTAYEYLERRFGSGTRRATSATFLVLRCLSLGIILAAPALVLAAFTGYAYELMVLAMGVVAVTYTSFGGLKAVISTDVKQMGVMMVSLIILFVLIVGALPDDVGFLGAIKLADAAGKVELANTSFDPAEKYTIWSALLGGSIIFLAYFGTDQSQVQRYLAGRSLRDKRGALILNAIAKVPVQFAILMLGVLIWAWSLYDPMPLVMGTQQSPATVAAEGVHRSQSLDAGRRGKAWLASDADADRAAFVASSQAVDATRLAGSPEGAANQVVPWIMKNRLPSWGITGLLLAGILAAALSTIDSELNSLATVATVDGLRLDPQDPHQTRRIVWWTRSFTVVFGVLSAGFALTLSNAGALIEVVNEVGSWFYGSLLGVFLLAWCDRGAHGRAAVTGLLAGMAAVVLANQVLELAWLWRNTVGTGTTVIVGAVASRLIPAR